ncbi:type II secretion system minor pseudopilin GspI [bacterium]|nr:type II secretion system minor pseudopilin GspI [bacterium]
MVRNRSNHRRSGFSLIEVLAALVIFSVSIVALVESLGTSSAMQNDLIVRQHALALAENMLEQTLAAENYDDPEQEGQFDGPDTGFAWKLKVESTDVTDLNKVTVTVTTAGPGRQTEASLSTLMAKRKKPDELDSGI